MKRVGFICEEFATHVQHKSSIERVAFTVTSGLLTLPRQYFGCLGITNNDVALRIWNQWWEFVASGPGAQTRVWSAAEDLGDGFVTFKDLADVDEDGCYIKVVSDTTEVTTERMLLKGTDENGELLRTGTGGDQIYGEEVDVEDGSGNWTTTKFKSLTQIVKPVTHGRVRLYASATSGAVSPTAVAILEPDETNPCLRRYRVPRDDDSTVTTTVEALCQLRSVILEKDDDILPISNLSALRDGLLSLHYKDQNDGVRAEELMQSAMRLLRNEHRRFHPMTTFPQGIDFMEPNPISNIY